MCIIKSFEAQTSLSSFRYRRRRRRRRRRCHRRRRRRRLVVYLLVYMQNLIKPSRTFCIHVCDYNFQRGESKNTG